MKSKFIISGTGCALADYLYANISFISSTFEKYSSRKTGDGGLCPGKLVFTEELEKFAGILYPIILEKITNGSAATSFNIGGPSLVSLIHAAQLLPDNEFKVKFFGISGKDKTAVKIRNLLKKTPVDFTGYLPESELATPFTHVLSDPDYNKGHGERTFINNIGAAWDLIPDFLPDSFFKSQMICFGGTALTPKLHDNLHLLLKKAKNEGTITLVNTVYDFRNEKNNPGKRWPLGESDLSYPNIDILIMDSEEALKISGASKIQEAFDYFKGVSSAFIITQGAEPVLFHSTGNLFNEESGSMNVSNEIKQKIQNRELNGDTTGCGDNFTGGVMVSIASQVQNGKKKINLKEAVVAGICSGGFTCSYHGGTFYEESPGGKKTEIEKLIKAYHKQ